MPTLFGRRWDVTIGDVDISDLAIVFNVKKTLKREPNTCELKVYNLAPDTRRRLTTPRASMVRVEAGYVDRVSQIYLGEVRALSPGYVEGSSIVTDLSSGDGEKAQQTAKLYAPLGPGVSSGDALRAIADALGVGAGNVPAAAARLTATGRTVFPRATALAGNAARVLDDFCRSAGLEWSIQDGVIQVLDLGAALETRPYVLSADSGLLGAPKLDSEGKVNAETLMIPELRPGMRVQFDSKFVTGLYRIAQIEFTGETYGDAWGSKLVCDKPGATE